MSPGAGASPPALWPPISGFEGAARFGACLFGCGLRRGLGLAGRLLVEAPLVLEVESRDVPEHVVADPDTM